MARYTGTIQWFSRAKGYGFIRRDDGGEYFVHHTAIRMEGFRALEGGERVTFEIGRGPRGDQAEEVHSLDRRDLNSFPLS
jgi:CspA family cold shock protein